MSSCLSLWERDVDTFLKSSSDSVIKLPGHVGSTEHQDTVHIVADTLHLDEELCFDATGGVILAFATLAAQRVDLINEDNGWLALSCHLEELLDQSLILSHPLGD